MTELFNITHDLNDLSEYDSTVTDGGDLSTGTPGLAGSTAKMEALIDNTNAMYGQKNVSVTGNDLRFRFYVDPNSLSMSAGSGHRICYWVLSDSPWQLCALEMYYLSGTSYQIQLAVEKDDSSMSYSGKFTITDASHYVEVHIERASSDVASDGQARLWIDGDLKNTMSSLDIYDLWSLIYRARLGPDYGIDATTSGTFYLDEFRANDDGGEIGPVAQVPVFRRRMEAY